MSLEDHTALPGSQCPFCGAPATKTVKMQRDVDPTRGWKYVPPAAVSAPQGDPPRDAIGWLIEGDGPARPVWWTGRWTDKGTEFVFGPLHSAMRMPRTTIDMEPEFSPDHACALRFARREDAERAIGLLPAVYHAAVKASEHMWMVRGVPAPQGDPPRYENDLAHLATLAPNWDSYGGVPITPAALAAVRAFIAQLQIVPRSNGGLQIEIHKEHHDLEVSFEPDGRIEEVYVENPDVGVPAPQGDAPPLRAPNNPHERKQRERLAAGDVDGFKRELLRSVQLYADVEAGRTCMGSPVIAENVLAGIAHQLDMLAVRGGASSSGSAPGELPVCANCGAVQLVRRASCPPAPSPERIERELRDGLYVAAALLCETRRHAGARPCSFCTGQIIAPYSEANIEARVDRGSPRPPEEER